MTAYITMWRKTGDKCLEWDFYVSHSLHELADVLSNLERQNVRQWSTHQMGERLEQFSDDSTKQAEQRKVDANDAHSTHCFQGEYPDTCKYGDDDCPEFFNFPARQEPMPKMVRSYGVVPGMRGTHFLTGDAILEVVETSSMDNNYAKYRYYGGPNSGTEFSSTAEHFDELEKNERCPECGEPVYSLFDHVDGCPEVKS